MAAVLVALGGGDRVDHLHARDDTSEHGVLGVELRRLADQDEELAAAVLGPAFAIDTMPRRWWIPLISSGIL